MEFKHWLMLFFLVSMFWYGYYIWEKENELLSSCSHVSKAIIIKKFERRKAGWSVKYKYIVDGVMYTRVPSIPDEQKDNSWVGDTIQIKYSCEEIV